MTLEIVALVVVAAFVLGALEGPRLGIWLKSWFVKEVTVIEGKALGLTPVTGRTGPAGA